MNGVHCFMKIQTSDELGLLAKTNQPWRLGSCALRKKKPKASFPKPSSLPAAKGRASAAAKKPPALAQKSIRQRLNQWNWRQKTALVTALAITATGTFAYQYRAHAAAAIAWPAVLASAGTKEYLVKLFVNIVASRAVHAALAKNSRKPP